MLKRKLVVESRTPSVVGSRPNDMTGGFSPGSDKLGLSTSRRKDAEGLTMKQARTGLLLGMVLMLVPAVAAAQGKGAGKPAPVSDDSVEIDADAPDDEGVTDDDTPEEGGGSDICKIDPDACPNIDMAAVAKMELNPQMYAVQQIYALRRGRFELQPYWSFTMNDQFVAHPGPGFALNYYFTNVIGSRSQLQLVPRHELRLRIQRSNASRSPSRRPTKRIPMVSSR